MPITPREVIEAARNFARAGRDERMRQPWWIKLQESQPGAAYVDIEIYMDLVVDCYLTGAAEMLKLLDGDRQPEPWQDNYNHEARLKILFEKSLLIAILSPDQAKTRKATEGPAHLSPEPKPHRKGKP